MINTDKINENNQITYYNEIDQNADANFSKHNNNNSATILKNSETLKQKQEYVETIEKNYVDIEILTKCLFQIQFPNNELNEIQNKDSKNANVLDINNMSSMNDNIDDSIYSCLNIIDSNKDLNHQNSKIEYINYLYDLNDSSLSILSSCEDIKDELFTDIFSGKLVLERNNQVKTSCIDTTNMYNSFEHDSFNISNDFYLNKTFNCENLSLQYENQEDNDYDFNYEGEIPEINHDYFFTNEYSPNNEYILAHHSGFEHIKDPISEENYIIEFKKIISNYVKEYSKFSKQLMFVNSNEEDWSRMEGIHIHNDILKFSHIHHEIVAFAQAKEPFSTQYNYFELEILDTGDKGCIAIGVTNKEYTTLQQPGWRKYSIAYHANDGNIFESKFYGDPFGPICKKGDRMGCGILFPREYNPISDEVLNDEDNVLENRIKYLKNKALKDINWDPNNDLDDERNDEDDSDEEEIENHEDYLDSKGTDVEVFFTKNGKMVGSKKAHIPRGGFFPSIGLHSNNEKVRVLLRPMTG